MYRKTLIMLACAVISAPAFAQSSLSECPHQLSRNQDQCRYLTPPSRPLDLSVHSEPDGYGGTDYKYGQRLERPSTPLQLPDGPLVVHGGMNGGYVGGYGGKF
jgi:hypothetical protein